MKDYQVWYKTNTVGCVIGCDSVEEGKAIIGKITKNAIRTDSKFDSVEFFIEDFFTNEVLFTSPRYITSTVEDINDINNLIV